MAKDELEIKVTPRAADANRINGQSQAELTERTRTDDALWLSEQRLRLAVRASNTGLWDWNIKTGEIYFSPEWKAQIGYEDHELENRFGEWEDRLHPDDLPIAVESFRRVFRGETPNTFEVRFLSKSGEYSVGECTAAPRVKNGRVVAASGIVRDITARKRAEEALRQAEREYRRIFENAVDGIFRSTPDGRFVLVNPALAAMLGYDSPEDLIESSGAVGFQCYANPERFAEYERLMKERGMVERFENQLLRKDGRTIWISETSRAVRGSNGELLCNEGTIREIERKDAEEAERQSEENIHSRVRDDVEGELQLVLDLDCSAGD